MHSEKEDRIGDACVLFLEYIGAFIYQCCINTFPFLYRKREKPKRKRDGEKVEKESERKGE